MDTYQLPKRIEHAVNGPDYAARSSVRHDRVFIPLTAPVVALQAKRRRAQRPELQLHEWHVKLYEYVQFFKGLSSMPEDMPVLTSDTSTHSYPEF